MGVVTWVNVLFVCIEYSSNELNLSKSYETKKPIRMSVNILWAFQDTVSFIMQQILDYRKTNYC